MRIINDKIIYFIAFFSLLSSCNKLVEVDPPASNINAENVYLSDKTAISVLTSLYVNMIPFFTGNNASNVFFLSALSSDELTLSGSVTNGRLIAFYKNRLLANLSSSIGGEVWTKAYSIIFICNSAIEGISTSRSLTASVRQQLLGEAFFVRAFCYFYLVNLYGDAPVVLATDPKISLSLVRAKKEDVYKQITDDLKKAQQMLSSNYLNGGLVPYSSLSIERVRPTKWAATALLSRVYLYTKDFVNAELESSKVIAETSLYDILPLSQVFLKNNREAIWQLQPIRTGRNNEDAFVYILPTNGPNGTANPVYLSKSLFESFESGDKRAISENWVNSKTVLGTTYYYSTKYKLTTGEVKEYPVILRLAEQYLIRAEARAQLNKLSGADGAAVDLNLIRIRAGLAPVSISTKEKMIADVLKERRVEFFLEGHRWLDIKRGDDVNVIMTIAANEKATTWESYRQLYPLPFSDIQRSTILKQNEGYDK